MSRLREMIKELCPDGVEFVPLWSVTIWDKKFNAVERYKQPVVDSYQYLLANDLFLMEVDCGDVFLLSTGEKTGWTTEDVAGEYLKEGEVVSIPWGKSRAVTDCIKYYKGKFVTADNRIATSSNTGILSNKYLYYWMMSRGQVIDSFYRGSGIKHPDMAKVLDMQIPVPPLAIQNEIVKLLDNFTELTAELTAELALRKKQYSFYRDSLLNFSRDDAEVEWKTLGETTKSISSGKNKIRVVDGEYPVYGSTGIIGYCTNFVYEHAQILVARVGSVGYVQIADGRYDVSDNTLIVDVLSTINMKYIFYYLGYMNLSRLAHGAGQPLITAGQLKKLIIPIPPLETQAKIVSILDRFDALCHDLTQGLPAEIAARKKQYEYYRDKLLTFPCKGA